VIYCDGVHLVGTDIEELIQFGVKIGLKPGWFQNHPTHPHYDILSKAFRTAVFQNGAVSVTSREIVQLMLSGKLCRGSAVAGGSVDARLKSLERAAETCGLTAALQIIRATESGKKPELIYSLRAQDPQTKRFISLNK
jgi:Protein of unknown function (DUF4031)